MGCVYSIEELQQNGVVLTDPANPPVSGPFPNENSTNIVYALWDQSVIDEGLITLEAEGDIMGMANGGIFSSTSFSCGDPGATLLHQGNVVGAGQFTVTCNLAPLADPSTMVVAVEAGAEGDEFLTQLFRADSTNLTCVAPDSGIMGDPHIKKWNGEWYDWHGECDTVFLRAPDFYNGLGLELHTRTKIQYGFSYIESAALRLGADILEVSSHGEYFLNDVESAKLPALMAGQFQVNHTLDNGGHDTKRQTFHIDLGHTTTIELKTHKQIVSFKMIHGNSPEVEKWFGSSSGLMGSFHESKTLARNGVTVLEDPNVFAQEWQVLDSDPKLFQNSHREPQFPELCRLPNKIASKRRKLLGGGVSRDEAAKACAHWKDTERENCIADVIATNDLDFGKDADGY